MSAAAPVAMALVPGLPHLLAGEPAPGWRELARAVRAVGDELRAAGAETLVVVSTQWLSVLGLQVQVRPVVEGTRVDENWYPYDFGTIPYRVRTDVALAEGWLARLREAGFQARPTSHPHFPVDTGLAAAMRLLDPDGRLAVAQVSLNLYGEPASVAKVGAAAMQAAEAASRRVALVAISGLSAHPLKAWIAPHEDRIASASDEQWNRRVLDALAAGRPQDIAAQRSRIVEAGAFDGQLRALDFLDGAAGLARAASVRAYGPVWGMGAAVVTWPVSNG